jgi:hypothetical protein
MKEPDKKHEVEHVAREAGLGMSERVEFLRELFPEAVAEGKVDWDKLRTALGELRPDEKRKIECGAKHFTGALGVNYRVSVTADVLPG